MQPKISVCVVAKNGAKTYKRLFDSLREFAERDGDMVLVDTGSTDDTPVIYNEFGFRVFKVGDKFMIDIPRDIVNKVNDEAEEVGDKPFMDENSSLFDFSSARNYASSLAKHDFIINPDADEELSGFDIDKIEELSEEITRFRYDFVFSHHADGSENHAFVTDTRASDRRHWKWRGHIHETMTPITKNPLMQYVPPHVFKVEHWQVHSPTRKNYLPGLAYACEIEPNNDRNLHYYGRELMYMKYYNLAIEKLKKHLRISNWDMEKSQSMLFIGDCYMALGEHDKGLEWYHKSFMLCQRRESLIRIANYWCKKDEPSRTIPYVAAALEIAKPSFYGSVPDYYTHTPHRLMYWAKWWTGDKETSKKHWYKAHEYSPDNPTIKGDAVFFKESCA